MYRLKKKILVEANRNLEYRFLKEKFLLREDNYVELANQKLKQNDFNFDLTSYVGQDTSSENILCIPKTNNTEKDDILKNVANWLDNNLENKGLLEIKLKETIKLIETAGATKLNTSLTEQAGSDSIVFGNTTISKEQALELGNDIVFLITMSLVHPKTDNKIIRKFCVR
jgi:hypothetical protein